MRPAPCTVAQNGSPTVGADLLRDWLGPTAPGVVNFFFVFSVMYFFQCRGVHCLVNHSCTALIRVLYCMCMHSALHVQFTFFGVFALMYSFFKFRFVYCFVGYVKTSFDRFCTAFVHNLHCTRPVCILYDNFITSKLS